MYQTHLGRFRKIVEFSTKRLSACPSPLLLVGKYEIHAMKHILYDMGPKPVARAPPSDHDQ